MIISRNFPLNINDLSSIDFHFYKTAEALRNTALQLDINKILLIQIIVTKKFIDVFKSLNLITHLLIHLDCILKATILRGLYISLTSLGLTDLVLPINYFLFVFP